jgi:hypothetical protein
MAKETCHQAHVKRGSYIAFYYRASYLHASRQPPYFSRLLSSAIFWSHPIPITRPSSLSSFSAVRTSIQPWQASKESNNKQTRLINVVVARRKPPSAESHCHARNAGEEKGQSGSSLFLLAPLQSTLSSSSAAFFVVALSVRNL